MLGEAEAEKLANVVSRTDRNFVETGECDVYGSEFDIDIVAMLSKFFGEIVSLSFLLGFAEGFDLQVQ